MRLATLLVLLLAGLAAGCGAAPSPAASARPLHVVLVVLDSVRADHVGALGSPRATTPRLDALAARGLSFERAWAASSFGPQARAALWTGRLPSHGGSIGTEAAPHPDLDTLPRVFRRAGYRTALASNHAELRARTFTRGFDALELDAVPGRWNAARVTEKALSLVDGTVRASETARADAPLFLVVDYTDAGPPHLPAPEDRERIDVPVPPQLLDLHSLRLRAGDSPADVLTMPAFLDLVARYDAEIAGVDRQLGRLVDGLEARGILEDALLVVTASHGVEFLEHGYAGSGWTLDEEVLRVPLVVVAPGRLDPGRIATPVSLADLFPTLAGLVGDADPGTAARAWLAPEGERLVPRVRSEAVVAELVLPGLAVLRAAVAGDEKLVEVVEGTAPAERLARLAGLAEHRARVLRGEAQDPDPLGPPLRRILFDLARDPAETRDLAGERPERVATLAAVLEHTLALARAAGVTPVEVPAPAQADAEALIDELRQVGYL